MKTSSIPLLLLALAVSAFAADPITESIRRGLLEEEVNRNLEAAAAAYQDAVNQADAIRQTAATALFRLGEVYRKQGRTNDAVGAYQRILRDFSDESSLVKTSREHLGLLGYAETTIPVAPGLTQYDPADVASLREELKLVENEHQAVQKRYENGRAEATDVRRVQRELLELQRKLPEFGSVDRQTELLEQELELAKTDLEEMRRRIQVGTAPPLDEIPLRRRILSIERELAAAKRGAATAPGSPTAGAGPVPATREENDELQRTEVMFRDSPDLVMNARNATPQEGTWLHKAAQNGYLAVADFLLAKGSHVDATDRKGWTPLHWAVESGHKSMCELLIAHGANVNATTRDSESPLQLAAKRGFREVAEVLLASGAEVNATGYVRDARTLLRNGDEGARMDSAALHWAAENGFPSMIELLLSHGADIEVTDRGGRTPLMRAVLGGQLAAARVLLSAGAKINTTNTEGKTALFDAVEAKNIPMTKFLLEQEADPETPVVAPAPDNQWTVLFQPVGQGEVPMTELLLDYHANVNARAASGITPVHWAVQNNAAATLQLLLDHKADPNLRDTGANTPLHVALEGGSPPLVESLLAAGADPNAPGWTSGDGQPWFPLFRAVTWSWASPPPDETSPSLTRPLLDHGANAKASTANGWTALHLAAQSGSVELAKMLLEHDADVNARGMVPQHWPEMTPRTAAAGSQPAQEASSMTTHRMPTRAIRSPMRDAPVRGPIVEIGYDPSRVPVPGVTPLHVAVAGQHIELTRYLLDHGASVNAADERGHTALHFAANRGNLDLTRLLLDAQADPNAKDTDGKTPSALVGEALNNLRRGGSYTLPTLTGYQDIIALFHERGARGAGGRNPIAVESGCSLRCLRCVTVPQPRAEPGSIFSVVPSPASLLCRLII